VQEIETTVQGWLGEWINVGGVNQTYNQDGASVLANTRRHGGEIRSVLIKVEDSVGCDEVRYESHRSRLTPQPYFHKLVLKKFLFNLW